MKRGMTLCFAFMICFALLTSCGSTEISDAAPDETQLTLTQAKEQPPIASKTGIYTESQTGMGSVEITAGNNGRAHIVVRWNNGADESVAWNMSGEYNTKKDSIRYEDGFKSVTTTDESGESVTSVVYRDGKGAFSFADDGLHWDDDEEHFADALVFVRVK